MVGITVEDIKNGKVVEGQGCDFKRMVDLDDPSAKSNFVSDVTAFLNAGAGHLLIGIDEKRGAFAGFHPVRGDPDAMCLRLQQVVHDNIEPRPTRVVVTPIPLDGGFLLDVDIPEHLLRPYQNRISGAFHLRTGARNTLLDRDALRAFFISREEQERDLLARTRAEDERLDQEGMMEVGPSLQLGILPREHYLRSKPPFRRIEGHQVKLAPVFHDDRPSMFEGCNGGFQAVVRTFAEKGYSRFFVGHNWFLHARVMFPFEADRSGGGALLGSLRPALGRFMDQVADFTEGEGLAGPFCVVLAIRGLRTNDKTAFLFPFTDSVELPGSRMLESLRATDLVDDFSDLVVRSSRYG